MISRTLLTFQETTPEEASATLEFNERPQALDDLVKLNLGHHEVALRVLHSLMSFDITPLQKDYEAVLLEQYPNMNVALIPFEDLMEEALLQRGCIPCSA